MSKLFIPFFGKNALHILSDYDTFYLAVPGVSGGPVISFQEEKSETSDEFRRHLIEALQNESDMEVVGETGDGQQLLEMVRTLQPDAVVMEMVLSSMDGIEVLEQLRELPPEHRPRILVLSSYIHGAIADLAAANGADHFMVKPCKFSTICARIRQLTTFDAMEEDKSRSHSLETLVTSIIHEVGVPAHIKGYQYLREAILIAVDERHGGHQRGDQGPLPRGGQAVRHHRLPGGAGHPPRH